jgi:hypothetical protein
MVAMNERCGGVTQDSSGDGFGVRPEDGGGRSVFIQVHHEAADQEQVAVKHGDCYGTAGIGVRGRLPVNLVPCHPD